MDVPEFVVEADMAKMIGKHPSTLRRWRMIGKPRIPYYDFGKGKMYAVPDAEAFIASCRREVA